MMFDELDADVCETTDSMVIQKFHKLISSMEHSHPITGGIRCKIYFCDGDTVMWTACMDRTVVLLDGAFYKTPPALITFVDSLEYQQKPVGNKRGKARQEYYRGGTEQLCNYLGNLSETLLGGIYIQGEHSMVAICTVNPQGKTTDVSIIESSKRKQQGQGIPEVLKDRIKSTLYDITWMPNKERMKLDKVYLRIRLTQENGLPKLYFDWLQANN